MAESDLRDTLIAAITSLPEREAQVLSALSERLSIAAVARMLAMSRQTIYDLLKKNRVTPRAGNNAA